MGIDKFLKDDIGSKDTSKSENIHIPRKNYKDKVNAEIDKVLNSNNYNLFDIPEKKENTKKVPMTMYFEKDDLNLLKAIAYTKDITVNKLLMDIIKRPLETTKENMPNNFDIDDLVKKYELKSNKTGRKKIK
mgnify:CR=1 FL=1|jgi:hypothetical protein